MPHSVSQSGIFQSWLKTIGMTATSHSWRPGSSIIQQPQVEQRTGLSRSSIYQKISEGTFPAPIRLSAKAVGWLSHEIDKWIEQRIRASRLVDKEVANDQ